MDHTSRAHGRWIIGIVFAAMLLLSIYPLAPSYRWYRPEWVLLLLIYWVLLMPYFIGPGWWWGVGLLQDVVTGSVLGQHALGTVIVGYLCLLSYQRIRNYTLWQQACWVFVVVGIAAVIYQWVNSLQGMHTVGLKFLWPAFISALIWPLFVFGLDQLRRHYRIQ